MKKLRKIRENKKGFTLVEVIVVLVIIATLAALLIPSLTGYITKANKTAAIAETRSLLVAIQTEASENAWTTTKTELTLTAAERSAIEALSELNTDGTTNNVLTYLRCDAAGKITAINYTASNGKRVTYRAVPAAGADKFVSS